MLGSGSERGKPSSSPRYWNRIASHRLNLITNRILRRNFVVPVPSSRVIGFVRYGYVPGKGSPAQIRLTVQSRLQIRDCGNRVGVLRVPRSELRMADCERGVEVRSVSVSYSYRDSNRRIVRRGSENPQTQPVGIVRDERRLGCGCYHVSSRSGVEFYGLDGEQVRLRSSGSPLERDVAEFRNPGRRGNRIVGIETPFSGIHQRSAYVGVVDEGFEQNFVVVRSGGNGTRGEFRNVRKRVVRAYRGRSGGLEVDVRRVTAGTCRD